MDEMGLNIFFKSQVDQIISGFAPTLCNEAWMRLYHVHKSQSANDCIQRMDIVRRILIRSDMVSTPTQKY